MDGNGWRWMEVDGNGWKWMEMDDGVRIGIQCLKLTFWGLFYMVRLAEKEPPQFDQQA